MGGTDGAGGVSGVSGVGRPLIGVSTYLEAGARWGCGSWRPLCCRPAIRGSSRRRGPRRDAAAGRPRPRRVDRRPSRRPRDRGRPRCRPGPLRRRALPADRSAGRGPRRLGTRPDRRRVGGRHPAPGHLPGHAAPQRRPRRHARPAHRRACEGRRGLRAARGDAGGGSLYGDVVPETCAVPTYHHQAVERLGED